MIPQQLSQPKFWLAVIVVIVAWGWIRGMLPAGVRSALMPPASNGG